MPETEVIVCSRPKTARSRPKSTASNLLDHLPPPKPNTAYKRYTPISPCCSKVLSYRWEQEKLQKHKEKIKTMKACIDNQSASRIDPKLKSLKQQVYKKELEKKIRRENEWLVEKIQNAWSKPASNYNDAYQRTLRDLDQKAKASEKRRVHRNAVIDAQNKALLERLKLARLKVDKDDGRKEHLRYLLKMSKFPEAYRRPEIMSRSNLTSASGKKERNKGKVPPFKA